MNVEHILESKDLNALLSRIERLKPEAKALWGKMNVAQMIAHVNASLLSPAGEVKGKQMLMGKFMSLFAKPMFVNKKPFKQGLPTSPHFLVAAEQDFNKEKEKLIALLKKINAEKSELGNRVHVFLGKITPEDWGRAIYKHVDHHLQQFGV